MHISVMGNQLIKVLKRIACVHHQELEPESFMSAYPVSYLIMSMYRTCTGIAGIFHGG